MQTLFWLMGVLSALLGDDPQLLHLAVDQEGQLGGDEARPGEDSVLTPAPHGHPDPPLGTSS